MFKELKQMSISMLWMKSFCICLILFAAIILIINTAVICQERLVYSEAPDSYTEDGIASLGWNLMMNAYNASGNSDIVNEMTNAINDGCDVINCSFTIDVSAPGINIKSTTGNNQYNIENGSSFSAPIVSALAGLILTVNPNLSI